MNWPVEPNFKTAPGQVLQALGKALPRKIALILFGSGALETTVCQEVTSADVDVCLDIGINKTKPGEKPFLEEDLMRVIQKAGLDRTSPYVQVCFYDAFKAPRKWSGRSMSVETGNCHLTIPHPWDILYAKMHRLEEKDLRAFEMVARSTGSPSLEEFLGICRENFRDFLRVAKGEAVLASTVTPGNLRNNVRQIGQRLFGRAISIERDIILPGDELMRRVLPPSTTRLKEMLEE